MKRRAVNLFTTFFVAVSLIAASTVLAAPYYEGKVITIVVGYAPGGGYDRMARLLAKHLSKYIPGNPSIVIQNMPGATSMIAANHLYNIAKADGLTIGSFDRGLPLAQLLKAEGVRFDLTKFSWIGAAAVESTILSIRGDLPYKDFNGLLKAKEPIVLGSVGPANTGHQFVLLLSQFVGLKARQIVYPSSADVILATERREVDGCAFIYNSMKPHIERGLLRPLIRSRVSQSGIEKLPVNEELTADKMGKTLMGMLSVGDQVGRPYVAPPGTLADLMRILRDAFAKVARDPDLQEEARKVMMDVQYVPAEESLKIIGFVLSQPPDLIKEFSKYVKF